MPNHHVSLDNGEAHVTVDGDGSDNVQSKGYADDFNEDVGAAEKIKEYDQSTDAKDMVDETTYQNKEKAMPNGTTQMAAPQHTVKDNYTVEV